MYKIIFNSLIILVTLTLAGLPLVILVYKKLFKIPEISGVIVLALSLTTGFGISAFASSWSYGAFGIKNYFNIFLLVTLLLWLGLVLTCKLEFYKNIVFEKKDWLILIPILISIYLSSTQWSSDLNPVLKVGEGPDVAQNIMAAQYAEHIGNTWFESRIRIQEDLGFSNLNESAFGLFKIPNAAELAAYDYLLFGVRWGLTVPYSQINSFFGQANSLLEVGNVLVTSLISLSIIFFAIGKLISKRAIAITLLPITVVANSTLMHQYLNGGLSQLVGTISLSGLILLIVLTIKHQQNLEKSRYLIGLAILITFALIGSLVTYVDAFLVMLVFTGIFILILSTLNLSLCKKIIFTSFASSIFVVLLVPSAIYANFVNLILRLKAAGGTGTAGMYWSYPSVHFGFANSYAGQIISTNHKLISALLFLFVFTVIALAIFRLQIYREYAAIGLAGLLTIIIGLYLSFNSNNGTTYIYDKITTYMSPLIIVALFGISASLIKSKSNLANLLQQTTYILSLVTLFSGISFINNYFTVYNKTTVPYAIHPLILNKTAQSDFDNINYLMPYKPSYNFGPVLGAKYWISKAPNDFNLLNRENKELRLFCFIGDQSCSPKTEKIANSFLETYGIVQYKSPISTKDFMQMSIDNRYKFNFEVFGMEVLPVPDKFKGGNPYFK